MALCDEIMLRGASYVFINGGRYFCRTEQAECKGISKQPRDFVVKKLHFSMGIYVDINLGLTFSLCSCYFWRNEYKTCSNSVVLISILCKQKHDLNFIVPTSHASPYAKMSQCSFCNF